MGHMSRPADLLRKLKGGGIPSTVAIDGQMVGRCEIAG
jgi:hypothetical protein